MQLVLNDEPDGTALVDLLEDGRRTLDENRAVEMTLDGYGYCWLGVHRPDDGRGILPDVMTAVTAAGEE